MAYNKFDSRLKDNTFSGENKRKVNKKSRFRCFTNEIQLRYAILCSVDCYILTKNFIYFSKVFF